MHQESYFNLVICNACKAYFLIGSGEDYSNVFIYVYEVLRNSNKSMIFIILSLSLLFSFEN